MWAENNISGEINRHEVCKNMIWFKFFCHFVDPDLAFEIFLQKDGATEYWDVDFEIEGWGTCCITVLGLRKFLCRASAFLLPFLLSKKNSFWKLSWPVLLCQLRFRIGERYSGFCWSVQGVQVVLQPWGTYE